MRLLVLGGTQFVGRAIVDAALADGQSVTVANRNKTQPTVANIWLDDRRVEHLVSDRFADELKLPFEKRLKYADFTLRFSEREALSNPLGVLKQLRAMPPQRIRQMQRALLKARPSFLWHTDPSRPSAVDQILMDMCDAAD